MNETNIRKDLFVSRRDGKVLIFSSKSSKAVLLSELEYLCAEFLIYNSYYSDDAKSALSRKLSQTVGVSEEDCLLRINRLEESLNSSGILPEMSKTRAINSSPKKKFSPKAIYLHLTNKCNLKCVYCYNSNYRSNSLTGRELNDKEIFDIIQQAVHIGACSFTVTGGEPLLRPSCLKIGAYITKVMGCYAELLTNGMLIDKIDVRELFNSYSKVVISLDSHIPSINDFTRGKGSYKKIVSGIRELCKIDPSRVVLRPVLHKFNISNFESYVNFACEKFGIMQIKPSLLSPRNTRNPKINDLFIDNDQYIYFLNLQEEILHDANAIIDKDDLYLNSGCGAGSSLISIGACGEVFACQAMHSNDLLAGSLREATLEYIGHHSPILKSMREMDPAKIEGCRDCSLMTICGGGCRANAHAIYGSIYSKNELQCPLEIRKCEYLLWKEAERKIINLSS